MIPEELIDLKNEFLRIKEQGYLKSTRKGMQGINGTLKDYLTKTEKTKNLLKYQGIEIKINISNIRNYITIFCANPEGRELDQIRRLRDKYGYTLPNRKSSKVLQNYVQANCSSLVGSKFLFKLKVDYEKEKVYLMINDKNGNLIEQKSYWTFQNLESILKQTMPYLVLVKAWSKKINKDDYYKYYDYNFYKQKDFIAFLKLLEDGTIRINFHIGAHILDKKINDYITSFEIESLDLIKLFTKLNI